MDRWRAAGALLALAACFACSAAAPTASNQTALDLYEGAPEGCYYNFQHYGEGDRIMTNEPCLNCTCHNRMLMCYLRVCPFTKAIGQDCTVEKRADQCCPIVTCPDVPVDLLTSTSTTSPAEYGTTGLGKLDKYGCSISGKYFPEGSKVPPTPNKPCEHCYCIRNMTTCVMQECTLHVDGCTPIYHKDVCCPVRYSCDHPEDEMPLLDDMSTTVRPTPGFLLTTTTMSPVTQMTQDCVHDDQIFADGALIKTEKSCEHCYCMKGDIVCVVQECGAPMENEGKNCTSLPPREGQCCPDTYICEGDELSSDLPTESTTEYIIEKLTTLSPPRRAGVEGSGYRNEPDEAPYTEIPTVESEVEGSGEEQETLKPLGPDDIIPTSEDGDQYIYVTSKAPTSVEYDQATTEINKNIIPDSEEKVVDLLNGSTTNAPIKEQVDDLTTSGMKEEDNLEPQKHLSTTIIPESYEIVTTEIGESLNTVPDVIPEEELIKPHEYAPSTTNAPTRKEIENILPIEDQEGKTTTSETTKPEHSTPSYSDEIEKVTAIPTEISSVIPEVTTEKEYTSVDSEITRTTSATAIQQSESPHVVEEEKEIAKPEQFAPSTTSYPVEEGEKLTTEPDRAQNTVAVAEEESTQPHPHILTTTIGLPSVEEEKTTLAYGEENVVTEKVIIDDVHAPHEHVPTSSTGLEDNEFITMEPDRGLNTIPSETNEESSSEPSLPTRTTLFVESKTTESSITLEEKTQGVDVKQTTTSETATLLPESISTKGDQHTITTEPSFRKEDESSISTEKPKEFGPTTVKAEFAEEGLIPTSAHDEKLGASSDTPSIDEEFTTIAPEYTKEITETIETKPTTESILIASVVTESLLDKVSEHSSEQDGESSTENPTDTTALVPEYVEAHEEPSRIPGEGDCLLNGVTYRNNSVVPSTNNCHTGCRCASSIIKCDPIICSPPPDYMDNCQSIYDSPDSCCPTYVCDHPRETVPPQSDNQMSGTESPMPSPTIECRGDQCEIIEPSKQPSGPSQLCTSGSCLTEGDHKPEIECGPDGCTKVTQQPEISLPSVEHAEECTEGKCPLPQTQGQITPTKPCEGEHCQKEEGVISLPSPQLCENEENCKTLEVPVVQATPCEGESCKKIDCGTSGCDSNVLSPPDSQQVSVPVEECTGDEPCRRKETTTDQKLPTGCEGSNCKAEMETQDVVDLITEIPISEQHPVEEVTQKEVEIEKATELPESHISTSAVIDTQEYSTEPHTESPITERDIEKEKPTAEATIKPTGLEEKGTEGPAIIDQEDKEKPALESTEIPTTIELEKTETPTIAEEGTDKPTIADEESKDKPTQVDVESEEKPIAVEKEITMKPTMIENYGTQLPVFLEEDKTDYPPQFGEVTKDKPIIDEEESTKEPTIHEEEDTKPSFTEVEMSSKPATIDEDSTDKPVMPEEKSTDKPGFTKQESTEEPAISEKEGTEIPAVAEEVVSIEPPMIQDKEKDKPVSLEKEATEEPSVVEEGTEKEPVVDEDGKDKPSVIDEVSDKEKPDQEIATEEPVLIEPESTDKPAIIGEDGEEKPAVFEKETTNKPNVMEEEGTVKPIVTDVKEKPSDSTEKSDINPVEETDKPILREEEKHKPDISEEGTEKPVLEDDKKQLTAIEQNITDKPAIDVQPTITAHENTEKPVLVDEEKSSESPAMTFEEGTKEPAIIEDGDTVKPVDEDDKKEVTVYEEGTKKPAVVDEESTKLPATVGDKDTEKPSINVEEGKEKPAISTEEDLTTKKPAFTQEESTPVPAITEKDNAEEPAIVEKESTETPASFDKEYTETPSLIEREGTELPAAVEEKTTKKPLDVEKSEQKPAIADEEGIKKPTIDEDVLTVIPEVPEEVSTLKPAITEKESTQKPVFTDKEDTEIPSLTDEDKVKPSVDEEDFTTTAPFEEESTGTAAVIQEGVKDKPIIIDEEIEENLTETEVKGTKEPQTHEEEGSGTEIPLTPESEVNLPEFTEGPTESPETELGKITKVPIYETQTTRNDDIEHAYSTELNVVQPIDISTTPQVPSEILEIKVTESKDSENEVPVSLDHSRTPDITTESLSEHELSTKAPLSATISEEAFTSIPETVTVTELNVQPTSPELDSNVNEAEGVNVGQDMINVDVVSTHAPELHEPTESVEKATEIGPISVQEVSTDSSKVELEVTEAPGTVPLFTEPQESTEPTKTELTITDKTVEESTTKVYEEKYKPVQETHETEVTSASPEQYGTSERVTEAPEVTIEDKPKPELPELPGTGLTTEIPNEVVEQEIKTDLPEIYKPDREETITESPEFSVTEPVRRFTETEDSLITTQEDKANVGLSEPTEHQLPSATEKNYESVDISLTTSEKPLVADIDSTKLPEDTPESDKLYPADQKHSTHRPESEKEKPVIIESPITEIPVITESQEISHIPEKHVTKPSYEEKTTSIPEILEQINKGTTLPEGYFTEQEAGTGIPQHHVTASEEYSKVTESYITESHVTEALDTITKSEEHEIPDTQSITTETSKTSIKEEEVKTKAPEVMYTETHAVDENEPSVTETIKLSSELPTSLEDVQTETPGIRLTSEIPQSLVTVHQETISEETSVSSTPEEEQTIKPELQTTQSHDITKAPELHVPGLEETQTETSVHITESVEGSTKDVETEIIEQYDQMTKVPEEAITEKQDTSTTLHETPLVSQEVITVEPEADKKLPELTTILPIEEAVKSTEHTSAQTEFSDTTPYLIELEEHTHKILEELTTLSPSEEEHTYKTVEDISTPSSSPSAEEYTHKIKEHLPTYPPVEEERTTEHAEAGQEPQIADLTTEIPDEGVETATKQAEASTSRPSEPFLPEDVTDKIAESVPVKDATPAVVINLDDKYDGEHKDHTTSVPSQISEESTPAIVTESEKLPISESEIAVPIEKETSSPEKPLHTIVTSEATVPEDEFIFSTTKATTVLQEEVLPHVSDDKFAKPEEKPIDSSEVLTSSTTEVPKPSVSDMQPTDEIPAPEEEGHFPPSGTSGYGEPDYVEEDQAFGPGTCRYGGKVYVSAQQIPRDDPCDFCFCFRSDIICLQQSCPPPIHGCHEEPIQGFCCPRYECPVSMATTVNVTTTTTTTTTTLPPHFPTHSYKGAVQRRGCQIKGHTYKVGEVVRSSSGPCLHCTCGGDGQMKCDPKACTPEPMLRQMIAAAVSAKRRR